MWVIGLTGSIAMGKSTTADMLRRLGIPVHDADATVHRLMAPKGRAVSAIKGRFPGVVDAKGAVDRHLLGLRVFKEPKELKALENILHPLVKDEERRFMQRQRREKRHLVVLDIPLLYETHGEGRCHAVWVVSAPRLLQTQRVLRRSGMTEDRLAAIRACQLSDVKKRKQADVVIATGLGRRFAWNAVVRGLRKIRSRKKGRE
ncbi:MAG: dephospho-CoA kinase [Rhodospirillaceae bacterium]|nr:dephospho-CoA kinase [Rhodospirillaceae bacterium]